MDRVERVRCHECGRSAAASLERCPHCRAEFVGLCSCGERFSLYDEACPSCGNPHGPVSYRSAVRTRVRLAIVLLVLVGLAVAGGLLLGRLGREDGGSARGELRRARAWVEQGKLDEARILLRRFLEERGDRPNALLQLAEIEHRAGRAAESATYARRALEIEPDLVTAKLALARADLLAGRAREALARALEATSKPEVAPVAHRIVAWALLSPGISDPGRAMEHLRISVDLGDREEQGLLLLARLLATHRPDPGSLLAAEGARPYLTQARERLSGATAGPGVDGEALLLRARIDAAAGRLAEAEEFLGGLLPDGRADAGALALLAMVRWQRRGDAAARPDFERLLAREDAAAGDLLELREFLAARGEDGDAARALARALELHPTEPEVLKAAIDRHLRRSEWSRAEALAEEALRSFPDRGDFAVRRARALFGRTGEPDRAIALLRAGIRDGGGPEMRIGLAELLLQQQPVSDDELAEAERLLARPEERPFPAPLRAARSLLLGRLALVRDDPTRALGFLEDAAGRGTPSPLLPRLLAEAHRRQGRHGLAAAELGRALEVGGEAFDVLLLRSDSLLRTGRAREAERDARRALDLRPEDSMAAVAAARAVLAGTPPDPEAALELLRRVRGSASVPEGTTVLLARALVATGRREEARREIRDALERDPTPDEELNLRRALLGIESTEGVSREDLRDLHVRFLSRHPGHLGAGIALTELLLEGGEVAMARDVSRSLLPASPGSVERLRIRFEALLESDESVPPDLVGARRIAADLHARAPDGPHDLYARARIAAAEENWAAAAELAGRVVGSLGEDGRAWTLLGLARMRSGDAVGAREALTKARELRPGLDLVRRLLAEAAAREGIEAMRAGDPGRALGRLDLARGLDPENRAIRDAHLGALARAGLTGDGEALARAKQDLERRVAELGDAGNLPERVEAFMLLGNLCRLSGDAEGFLRATESHLEIAPDDPVAVLRRAGALEEAGRAGDARRVLAAANDRLGSDPLLTRALALLLLRRGDREGARRVAEEARRSRPEEAEPLVLLARLAEEAGDGKRAKREFRSALRADPAHLGAAAGLVRLLLAEGDGAGAERLLSELIGETGGSPTHDYLLGRVLFVDDPGSLEAARLFEGVFEAPGASPVLRLSACLRLLEGHLETRRIGLGLRTANAFLTRLRENPEIERDAAARALVADCFGLAGIVHQLDGGFAVAESCYREALERRPGDPAIRNNLADLLSTRPDRAEEAADLAALVVEAEPGWPEGFDTLGTALRTAGRPAEAVQALLRAEARFEERIASDAGRRETATALARTRLKLARIWSELREPGKARAALEAAVRADPAIAGTEEYLLIERTLR